MPGCFSFFKAPVKCVLPCREIGAEDVVKYLRSDFAAERTRTIRAAVGAERRALKSELLDFVTFSGVFVSRRSEGLKMYSGLMCFDVDHIENAEGLRAGMAEDAVLNPMIIFVSPSGDGLKVVVSVEDALLEDAMNIDPTGKLLAGLHRDIYECIADYIRLKHGVVCDGTHDVARCCFLCEDKGAYYNAEARTLVECIVRERVKLKWEMTPLYEKIRGLAAPVNSVTAYPNHSFASQMNNAPNYPAAPYPPPYPAAVPASAYPAQASAYPAPVSAAPVSAAPRPAVTREDNWKSVERALAKMERCGRNVAEGYREWLLTGFALAGEFGESGRVFFHRISSMSSKYNPAEADRKYDECLRNGNSNVTLGSLFYLLNS